MGSYFGIGRKSPSNIYGEGNLSILLNRYASNALEALFDEALEDKFSSIHEKVMEMLPLDQVNFFELNESEFNLSIKAIQDCLDSRINPNENQIFQKHMWETEILPLMKQDERYQLLYK